MMGDLSADIDGRSQTAENPMGHSVRVISDMAMKDIAEKNNLTVRAVSVRSLSMGITPLRYLRNSPAISLSDQLVLGKSQVTVAGAGGLGGHVILLLARLGVGRLRVFDPDTFDETNLNRQALCFSDNLGAFKAYEAARQCAGVNPAVEVFAHPSPITASTPKEDLSDTDALVDALDTAQDRLVLSALARELNIPLVHGTVAGFEGRVMTICPGGAGMETLYQAEKTGSPALSAENLLGTPALAPALVATFQAMAVVNLLLRRTTPPDGCFLHLDLTHPSLTPFFLDHSSSRKGFSS